MSLSAAKRAGEDMVEIESDGMLVAFGQLAPVAANDIPDVCPFIFNYQAGQHPEQETDA